MPHLHEKIDWTVEVFIVHNDRVLLRKHDKYQLWLAVGGHVELDEEPTQAALREVQEEIGLAVSLIGEAPALSEGEGYRELLAPAFMNIHAINETHAHIGMIYFARADTDALTEGEGEVSGGMHWFTEEELESPAYEIRETIKHYAKAALRAARR